jgi:hypothetical protein
MSVDEELSENAEHAKEPFDKKVAVTMAIIAAILAMVTVLGHLFSNEELLAQQKASDQWAYSQAKDIRRYDSEIARDVLNGMTGIEPEKVKHYSDNVEKYGKEKEQIQEKATELGNESDLRGRQALRLETSEVFLEIGIVFASLAILSKRPLIWWLSMGSAATGIAIALTTKFVT